MKREKLLEILKYIPYILMLFLVLGIGYIVYGFIGTTANFFPIQIQNFISQYSQQIDTSAVLNFLQSLILFSSIVFAFYIIVVIEFTKKVVEYVKILATYEKLYWTFLLLFFLITPGILLTSTVYFSLLSTLQYGHLLSVGQNVTNSIVLNDFTKNVNSSVNQVFLGGAATFMLLIIYILMYLGLWDLIVQFKKNHQEIYTGSILVLVIFLFYLIKQYYIMDFYILLGLIYFVVIYFTTKDANVKKSH